MGDYPIKNYMLFGSELCHYASGGMHDFLKACDTREEALEFVNLEHWKKHGRDLEWWHVYDRMFGKICIASDTQPYNAPEAENIPEVDQIYHFNETAQQWVTGKEQPPILKNEAREKVKAAREKAMLERFEKIIPEIKAKAKNFCRQYNTQAKYWYPQAPDISEEHCQKCEKMPTEEWLSTIALTGLSFKEINPPAPLICEHYCRPTHNLKFALNGYRSTHCSICGDTIQKGEFYYYTVQRTKNDVTYLRQHIFNCKHNAL